MRTYLRTNHIQKVWTAGLEFAPPADEIMGMTDTTVLRKSAPPQNLQLNVLISNSQH